MTTSSQLTLPPIHDPLLIKNENEQLIVSPIWAKWFDQLYNILSQTLIAGKSTINDRYIPVFKLPSMTTITRDSIINPIDGIMIYNTTTSQGEIRAGGVWNAI